MAGVRKKKEERSRMPLGFCDPCGEAGRETPSKFVYQMITIPGPSGRFGICLDHAESMRRWSGEISPREISCEISK